MKKNRETVSIVLLIMMLLDIIIVTNLAWVGMAIADPNTVTSAEFVIGLNQYFVNNQVPGIGMDAAPYIDSSSGRTLIPVRYLANAVGAQTAWAGTTQTVTVTGNGMTISMVIGNTALTVNDQAQTLDQAPVINNGRTYLPARWVAQALGYQVGWDVVNKIVIIWTNGTSEPDYSNVAGQVTQSRAVSSGFTIPAGTKLTFSNDTSAEMPIDITINTSKGDVQSQVADAQNILSQAKFLDSATVAKVMAMIDLEVTQQKPEAPGTFNSSNGGGVKCVSYQMGNGNNAYMWIDVEVSTEHIPGAAN